MAFMARNPREGQVSIGVVEHAMFWDLPRLGTTDVVCNRSLAKLQEGPGNTVGSSDVSVAHTACLNLRSFDPHLFVGNLPQKPILGSNTLMAPIRPPHTPPMFASFLGSIKYHPYFF